MKRILVSLSLLSTVILPLTAEAQATASRYWSDNWRGWHFYEEPEPEPEDRPFRPPRPPLPSFDCTHCRQAARDRRVRAPAEGPRGDPAHRHHAADRSQRAPLHGAGGQGGVARIHLRRRGAAHRLGHARARPDAAGPPGQRQGAGGVRPASDGPAQRVHQCAGPRPCAVLLLPQRLPLLPCLRADAGGLPGPARHQGGGDQRRRRPDARLPGRPARQRHRHHAAGEPGSRPSTSPSPSPERSRRSASACCPRRSWWSASPSSRRTRGVGHVPPRAAILGRPDDSRGAAP
jgi:hypothetical protein